MCLRNYRLLCIFLGVVGCGDHPLPRAEQPRAAEEDVTSSGVEPSADDELPNLWTRRQGTEWPRFLGPSGDSISLETGVVAPWPPQGPRVVWQRRVGLGYGIGSVSRGRYFHFDRRNDPGDDRSGPARVRCLHGETGDELWHFEYASEYRDFYGYNNGPRCSPVVEGNRVYVFGVEGMLHCLRADDGRPIWHVDTQKDFGVVQNFFGVGSTPVIEGDLLICMVGGSPPGSPSLHSSGGPVGNGSGVVAFNKYTGQVVYQITDELASYASPKLATIHDRRWCFVFAREALIGFDPATGAVDFRFPWRASLFESVNASTPVVAGDEVFISEAYQVGSCLLSVEPGACKVVWQDDRRRRDKALRLHWNTPIFRDGYLYGCSGRHTQDAELRCVEWKTGRVVWSHRDVEPERSSLLYVDGYLVCLGEYGRLQLIEARPDACRIVSEVVLRDDTGSPLLGYPCWAAPILAHGMLYVRGEDRVVCLELIPEGGG